MPFHIALIRDAVEVAVAELVLRLHSSRLHRLDALVRSASPHGNVISLDGLWKSLESLRVAHSPIDQIPGLPTISPASSDRLASFLLRGSGGKPPLSAPRRGTPDREFVAFHEQVDEIARVLLAVDVVTRRRDAFPGLRGSLPSGLLASAGAGHAPASRQPTPAERDIVFEAVQVGGWDGSALLTRPLEVPAEVFAGFVIDAATRLGKIAADHFTGDEPPEYFFADLAGAARQVSAAATPPLTMHRALQSLDAIDRLLPDAARELIALTRRNSSMNLFGLAALFHRTAPATRESLHAAGLSGSTVLPHEAGGDLRSAAQVASQHLKQPSTAITSLHARFAALTLDRLSASFPPLPLPPPDPPRAESAAVQPPRIEAAPVVLTLSPAAPSAPNAADAWTLNKSTAVTGGNSGFLLSEIVMIDTWVKADWDPSRTGAACLLSLSGASVDANGLPQQGQARFSLFVAGHQKELTISRSDPDAPGGVAIDKVACDFSDRGFHHLLVCLSNGGGATTKIRVKFDAADQFEVGADDKSGLLPKQDFQLDHVQIGSGGDDEFDGAVARLVFGSVARFDTVAFDQGMIGDGVFGMLRFAAGVAVFDLLDDPIGFWGLDGALKVFPNKLTISGVAPEDHAQYECPPFLGISLHEGGWVLMTDNGGFTPVAMKPGQASTLLSATGSDFPSRVIHCVREVSTGSLNGRTVRSTLPQLVVDSGAGALRDGLYTPVDHGTENPGLKETWGSAFLATPVNSEFSLRSWDVTRMDSRNSMDTGAYNYVLSFPPNSSKRYVQTTFAGDPAVPFGLAMVPVGQISGELRQQIVTCGQDVKNSITDSTGVSFHVDAGVEVEGVGVDASFRHSRNESAESESARMYEKEVMYSVQTIRGVAHEMIVDKPKAMLAGWQPDGTIGGFLADVFRLRAGTIAPDELIRRYGTHYAYTIAYGARLHQMNTYTKQSATTLVANKTNLEIGNGASLKVKAGALGVKAKAGEDVDLTSSESQAQATTLRSTLKDDFGEFEAFGGDGWRKDDLSDVRSNPIPVMVTLRPLTELLGPPFFLDFETAVTTRRLLAAAIAAYIKELPDAKSIRTDPPFQVPGFPPSLSNAVSGGH